MPLEVPYTAPEEKNDVYKLEREDLLAEVMTDVDPKELATLFVTDREVFFKKFLRYITSDKMKQKYDEDVNWEWYKHDMKAYFENMDEKAMKSKNLPLPLIEGFKDIFAVGMSQAPFKNDINETLQDYFSYDKKTDTFIGDLQGSDIGGSITGKLLLLYKSLYNNRGKPDRA